MKLGRAARETRDTGTARKAYEASLEISSRLAGHDPGNATWRNDLEWVRKQLSELPPDDAG
jgi:hypothetical protein